MALLPKIFVGEFVRDEAAQIRLTGDSNQLGRDDEGGAIYQHRFRLIGTHHVNGPIAVPCVVSEHGLESR